MTEWHKPEYLKECLPNKVFRFRKQAQSKYHKVVITDEANLSTLLPTCYKSVTLLFVDNMNTTQLELLVHIHKCCKYQKVVFLYTCGLTTMLSRYSLANTANGANCCTKCDLYLYNHTNEDLFDTMISLRGLISSSMAAMCYFLPTALPPFSIKWHVTQFQAEHQQCCPHAMKVLSASDISKSVRDQMQVSLDQKLAHYNQLVNADCKEKNLPIIDWSKTYLTNTNLNEREKNIMTNVTSLLCDFISVIYQDECSQELQQIQNTLSASDDEILVKEEPCDPEEESFPAQSTHEEITIKIESLEDGSESPRTPRRSPRKLSSSSLVSSNQNTPEASNSLDALNVSKLNSPGCSYKRKLGSKEHSNTRSKRNNVSSGTLPSKLTSANAGKESTYEREEVLTSTSDATERLEEKSSTDELAKETIRATKRNVMHSSISCVEETIESESGVVCDETLQMESAASGDDDIQSNGGGGEQDDVSLVTLNSEAPSNNNEVLTDEHEGSESQEVLVITPKGRQKKNTNLSTPCTVRRADSSSDIQILENIVGDVICLSNQSVNKLKGRSLKVSSSTKKRNGNNIGHITSTSQHSFPSVLNKSVTISNDDLVVIEQDAPEKVQEKHGNVHQNRIQNITNDKSTDVNEEPISSCSIEQELTPLEKSICMDISEERSAGTSGDLTKKDKQNKDGTCLPEPMDVDKPKITDEDLEVSSLTSKKSIQCAPLQSNILATNPSNNDDPAVQHIVKSESITELPVIPNSRKSSRQSNPRSVARFPSITELPITPKLEQDSMEDVKPVLAGNGGFDTPGYVAIRQSPIPKRDRRRRESSVSIASTASTDSSAQQPPEFVESDVSVFKRTDAKGDALHILITDERLDAVTDLLVSDLSYTNCMHICGHDTTIPQMNNSIKEALVETRKLKMNQSKHLIVAVCLGTVDIINLLGTLKSLPASCRKPKKVKYTTPEVVTLVYNRLVLLKRSIKELDPNARVVLFKLPPTQVGGNVKIAIDQVNSLIHRCNRDDKTVSSGTQYPLKKLCKVSEPSFTLNNESTAHWLETCKFVISLVEKTMREEKEAAKRKKERAQKCVIDLEKTMREEKEAAKRKKERAQKCVIDLEAPQTSGKRRLPVREEEGRPNKVAKTDANSEPEVVEERSGKEVTRTESSRNVEPEVLERRDKGCLLTDNPGNIEPEVVEEGSGMKHSQTDSPGNIEPEVVEERSGPSRSQTDSPGGFEPEILQEEGGKNVIKTAISGSFEPEVVDVEEERGKKKLFGSDASGKRHKTKKRSVNEVFINKHDNIVCVTPGSVQSAVRRSSPRKARIAVPDEPSSSSTTSSAPASKFLPEDDSVSKQVNAYMRMLLLEHSQEQQEDEVIGGASSQLSCNVCALAALSRVTARSSTQDSEALLAAARRLHEHEQSANLGSPSLEHAQKKAIIGAVGDAVQYLEDAAIGQEVSDVLYAAVLNVKKVYAA